MKLVSVALAAAGMMMANGGYKADAIGAAPAELAPAISALLQDKGIKVTDPAGKVWCELWFVKAAPKGTATTEQDVVWKMTPHGSLIGAIRFPAAAYDRRGQNIKPGVYTLRFSFHPINGDHQGVAPQRDFLVLTPADSDKTPEAVKVFDDLMKMSRKTSGTPHPAVLSMYPVDDGFQPGMVQQGEHDWALHAMAGDAKIALTLIGKAE